MPPLETKQEQSWAGWLDLTVWLAGLWLRRGLAVAVLLLLLLLVWLAGRVTGVNEATAALIAAGRCWGP